MLNGKSNMIAEHCDSCWLTGNC